MAYLLLPYRSNDIRRCLSPTLVTFSINQLKKQVAHIARPKKVKAFEPLSFRCGGFAIDQRREDKLSVVVPRSIKALQQIEVNGVTFYLPDCVHQVVRVAPVIFTNEQFTEVDALIGKGYGSTAACNTIADKYGHKPESLRQQYYKRHFSKKIIPSKSVV